MAVEPTAATKASVTLFSGHESGRWATTLVSSAQYPECVDGTVPGCVGSALRIDFTRVSTSQSATKRVLSGIQTSSFVHTCKEGKFHASHRMLGKASAAVVDDTSVANSKRCVVDSERLFI